MIGDLAAERSERDHPSALWILDDPDLDQAETGELLCPEYGAENVVSIDTLQQILGRWKVC